MAKGEGVRFGASSCPREFLLIFITVRSRAGKRDMVCIGDEDGNVERVGRAIEMLTSSPTEDFLRRRWTE